MLGSIARFSVRHRWLVVAVWLVTVAGALVLRQGAGGHFSNDLSVPGTDSDRALAVLHEKFPGQSGDAMQVVVHAPKGVNDPNVRGAVTLALARASRGPDVAGTVSPYGPQGLVSADGTTAVATVQFAERAKDIPPASIDAARAAAGPIRATGAQVEFGGAAVQAEPHPNGAELLGLLAAVVVLLFVFGSVFAMVVPLLTALLGIGLGMSLVGLLTTVTPVGTAAPVVAAMIGLGVGIDYALLIVTRHREGMAARHPAGESIPIALSTAGRSVLVAGSTVIIAILSLYLIGIRFVSTLGLASAVTVAATLLAATTLLPALLAVFGDRLDRYRVRPIRLDRGDGRVSGWHRWTRRVERRPWPYLAVAVVALVAVAVPLFSLHLGSADAGANPTGDTSRRAYDLVARDIGPGWTGPLLVTASFGGNTNNAHREAQAARLRDTLAATPGVAAVAPPRMSPDGAAALLTVVPVTSPQDARTETLVHGLRDRVLPAAVDNQQVDVHVGGQTAMAIDLADRLSARMPWFIGFVVGLSMLLLLVEFRSVFVPVKAALMNLLSVGAAYGAVVAAFQWGWLPGAQAGPIESFAPMMLFAVLFGLSMDYEVFLLSRVREEYLTSGDARRSVADGIAATARVITAAASVMVVVFASFLLNEQRVVNMFGFGLAVAVALDATIVRLVLVPAAMSIAGRRAWWIPRRLDRIVPHIATTPRTEGAAMPVFPTWPDTVRFSADGPTPTVLQYTEELKVVLVGLEPGQVLPDHPAPAASFHVLEGKGVITVDGTSTEVAAGATIVVPSGATRGWRATTRLVFLGSLGNPAADKLVPTT